MELLKKRLANLLSVKSIVTLCLTITFCVLTVQNAATFDGAVRQHEVMMDQIRHRDIDALRRELTDHVRKIIAEKNVLLQLYPDYFATAQQEMKL